MRALLLAPLAINLFSLRIPNNGSKNGPHWRSVRTAYEGSGQDWDFYCILPAFFHTPCENAGFATDTS